MHLNDQNDTAAVYSDVKHENSILFSDRVGYSFFLVIFEKLSVQKNFEFKMTVKFKKIKFLKTVKIKIILKQLCEHDDLMSRSIPLHCSLKFK